MSACLSVCLVVEGESNPEPVGLSYWNNVNGILILTRDYVSYIERNLRIEPKKCKNAGEMMLNIV